MERKERICAYISSEEYIPLKLEELKTVLEVPAEATEEFKTILDELCAEGRIYLTKKLRYMPSESKKDTMQGILTCSARGYFGFVENEGGDDVYVKDTDMNGALNRDTVIVRIKSENKGFRKEGEVIRIAERANSVVVGVLSHDDEKYYYLTPDNRRLYTSIKISPQDIMEAEIGDRAAVKITSYDDGVHGRILAVLGDKDSLKSNIEGIIIENSIKQEFDHETIQNAEKVRDSVTEEEIRGRLDLRDELIFTIDGDDARDFDDAVSLEILQNGNYKLGVHIADVTHYVTEGSALDNEAMLRGTSVYLADRVIPMLPTRLSNGICSLNPHEDRLTLSVIMEIDKNGNVVSHSIERAVINSKERMTYNNVTKLLEGDTELYERYGYMLPTLRKMKELSDILENMRRKRGAIDFDFPETRVIVDENGEPVDIVPEDRGVSNKIIEEFMLTANETVAEYAYWSELPFVYRVHEPPSGEKIEAFNKFISHFGLHIRGKIDNDNPIHSKTLQSILESVKGTPEERMVSSNMLRSLMKAEYETENLGHFGLGAKYYCHFTSPIRRYPDLAIHRILKDFTSGKMTEDRRKHFAAFADKAAKRSSEAEINAEAAERDVDDLMKTVYMSAYVGADFNAVISGITGFGIFVELENSVEGLIRVENMKEDYFEYGDSLSALIGKHTGRIYRIGDELEVTLVRTDAALRQIDFVLSSDVTNDIFRKFQKRDMLPRRINRGQIGRHPAKRKHKRQRR